MAVADLAIGAAGSTSYERCCLGLPSVVVVTASNQALNSEQLARHGAVVALGPAHGLTAATVCAAVESLLGDARRLHRLSQAAAAICDGLGAARVADGLEAVIAGGAAGSKMAVQS
jgi:spore coat polysaccharide biosynthesis predicted glycosyltransferase SpsG